MPIDNINGIDLATLLGLGGLGFTILSEKTAQAKWQGKLEQKVDQLDRDSQALKQLVESLHETNLTIARIEQKLNNLDHSIEEIKAEVNKP